MTKKKVFKPSDPHAHYWDREFEVRAGHKQWRNVWICRWCATETDKNPFAAAPAPDEQEKAFLQMALHRRTGK